MYWDTRFPSRVRLAAAGREVLATIHSVACIVWGGIGKITHSPLISVCITVWYTMSGRFLGRGGGSKCIICLRPWAWLWNQIEFFVLLNTVTINDCIYDCIWCGWWCVYMPLYYSDEFLEECHNSFLNGSPWST